jgi:hypothetical protein
MSANRADVWKLIGYLEGDLRGVHAKLTELRSMLASGALDRAPADEKTCHCGVVCAGDAALAEHRYDVHEEGLLCLECGRVKDTCFKCLDEIRKGVRDAA